MLDLQKIADQMRTHAEKHIDCATGQDELSAIADALAASAPTVGPDEFRCPLCFDDPANIAAQEASSAAEPVAWMYEAKAGDMNPIVSRHRMAEYPNGYRGEMWAEYPLYRIPPTPPSAPAGAGEGEQYAEGDAAAWAIAACTLLREAGYSGDMKAMTALREVIARAASAPPSHEGEDARDAARWRYAMDWQNKNFAVCIKLDGAWCPCSNSGPIDAARAGGSAA